MTDDNFSPLIAEATLSLIQKKTLNEQKLFDVFSLILQGVSHLQLAAFLSALAVSGEKPAHIRAARRAMLSHMEPLPVPPSLSQKIIDIVGTGGDGLHTLNISTTAAILVASTGMPVAKHGNRAVSSKSGAADVLQALGLKNLSPIHALHLLSHAKFAFLFAPLFHPAMKHVAPVRQALKIPTLFNILGPLCNPAHTPFMIVGASGNKRQKLMAEALLGNVTSALVIGNSSGADEIIPYGTNSGYLIKNNTISPYTFTAEDAGFQSHNSIDALKGGDASYNASRVRDLFSGNELNTLYYDSVIMTASAALLIAGKVASLREGSLTVANALNNKKAAHTLELIVSS